jgi:uncharacterized NAD(P)/FAD-binding protein YdhS
MTDFDIAIIGDGFCSLMTAANLARSDKKVAVFGRAKDPLQGWGPGLAYGKCHPQHLLNVPTVRMGAYESAPDGFLKWLRTNISIETLAKFVNDGRPLTHAFMPRVFYAEYLRGIAKSVLPKVKYITGDVVDIDYADGTFTVFHSGGKTTAKNLVLATGVPAALKTPGDKKLSDPWSEDFSIFRTSKKPVIIFGMGLTMVDVVSSLAANGFKGKIHAVSRRGLLPEVHAHKDADISALVPHFKPLKGTLSQRMQALRRNAKACTAAKLPWQSYFDYLRPYTHELWETFTPLEQEKFIRRLLPYWNIHRHRQPRETAVMLARMIDSGQLIIHKGKAPDLADASYIFNCRGADYSMQSDSLLRSLIDKGLIVPNDNGLGAVVDSRLSVPGAANGALYIAGSLTAGTFLEATAVPELRTQCAQVAQSLL